MLETTKTQPPSRPYRYDEISARGVLEEFSGFGGGPEPGEPLPDFDLLTTDGRRVRKSDFVGQRPALITFASLTCPMTAASAPTLAVLYETFGRYVAFLTVYVREAHPGENVPQARDRDEKLNYAVALQRRESIPWTIAVDELDGDFHTQMGGHPNACYLVDDGGHVAFRSLWSSDEAAIANALEALVSGRAPLQTESKPRLGPMLAAMGTMSETLEQAGPSAQRQARRRLAPLYGLSRVARLFSPLPPAGRGAAAVGMLALGLYALVKVVARSGRGRVERP